MSRYLETGHIVGTFGLKGELKVISDANTNRFVKGNTLYFGKTIKHLEKVTISSSRILKGMHVVTINDLQDINLVEKYIGYKFFIDRDELDDLDNNQYYFIDLIGLDVYYKDKCYGKVIDVLDLPTSSVLEIELENKKILVPFVDNYVLNVLVNDNLIIMDKLEEFL